MDVWNGNQKRNTAMYGPTEKSLNLNERRYKTMKKSNAIEEAIIENLIQSLRDGASPGQKKLAAIKDLMRSKKISLAEAWREISGKQ